MVIYRQPKQERIMVMEDEKLTIVKSNYLVEASYRLTLQEQRIILFLASLIQPEDDQFNVYRVSIKQFAEVAGLTSNNRIYEQAKKITSGILDRRLTILEPGKSLLQANWLASAEYLIGEGVVELELSHKLKPFMLGLKERFTKYQLTNVIKMRSVYGVRIYELLKQYLRIGERTITLEELRRIIAIPENEYKMYGHFKDKVIKTAQREMSKHSDISFEFKEIKQGRKVHAIRFIIAKSKPKEEVEILDKLVSDMIEYYCITPLTARKLFKKYGEEHINKALDYVKDRFLKGLVNKETIGGYTTKAIEQGYQLQTSKLEIEVTEKKQKAKQAEKEKITKERLEAQYEVYRKQQIDNFKETSDITTLKKQADKQAKEATRRIGAGYQLMFNQLLDQFISEQIEIKTFEEWKDGAKS